VAAPGRGRRRRARGDHHHCGGAGDPGSSSAATRSWSRPSRSSRRRRVSSCGRATRDAGDLRVHRRAPGSVQGRSDLPCGDRARGHDRPENVLRVGAPAAIEAGAVRHRTTRGAGRLLPAGPARSASPGVAVRVGEDVGPPQPGGRHGRQMHGEAADAGQRLAGGAPPSAASTRSRPTNVGSSPPAVRHLSPGTWSRSGSTFRKHILLNRLPAGDPLAASVFPAWEQVLCRVRAA
jgi:hypothetical protein